MNVRPIESSDLPDFIELCQAHAAFERSSECTPDAQRLRLALFSTPARLYAWVAIDAHSRLVGYATATLDYSTWSSCEFMHLDCLFVRDSHRGRNIGQQLLSAVREHARALGLRQMQWQTPDWNTDAQRFYERLNAIPKAKVRYVLEL